MSQPSVRHVFVYGTLRRGQERDINLLSPAPRWMGPAVVQGMLYHLGSYPGLVLGGSHQVWGEVYEITLELERVLDEIEEVWPQQTGEYKKREILVKLHQSHVDPVEGAPAEIRCIVYEIAPERTHGKSVIISGDWTAR